MNAGPGRIIKRGESVALAEPAAAKPRAAGPAQETACPAPVVTLHRNGDVVEAVEVTCGCGRTLILQCEYEESAS